MGQGEELQMIWKMASKALYDAVQRIITLTEGPRLMQGADFVAVANTIIVYFDTE